MKKITLLKTLLMAVCLFVGTSATWAYTVPSGYEIKDVFIGTNNAGTIEAETFSSGTYDSNIFGPGTLYHASGTSEKIKMIDYSSSYVAAPEVGETCGDGVYPTYVGGTTDATKYVLAFRSRGNGTSYGTIGFNNKIITKGKLVFSVDLNFGGYDKTNAPQIIFVDKDGNHVLQLGYKCSSGNSEYFQYAVNGGVASNDGTVTASKLRDKYTGHSIRDIVIDMETGAVVYTVDCIGTDGKRYSTTTTKNINIGTGKNIAGIRISRDNTASSQDHYIYMDNMELYTVVPTSAATHTYTINAVAGGTTIKTLKTATCNEYEDYEYYAPKCIFNDSDNKYYVLDDANLDKFRGFYTMGTSNETKEISYTLDESIVYFEEGESNTVTTTNGNFSNGKCSGYRKGGSYKSVTISEEGVYNTEICIGDGDGSKSRSFAINTKSGDIYTPIVTVTGNIGATRGSHFNNIRITEETTLYTGYSANTLGVDYIIIRKLTNGGEILGNIDYTTNYGGVWNTTPVWINAGETGYYKIKNWNNTASANLYENWYIWAANESSENLVIFGPDHSNTATNATYNSKPTFTMDDLNGATVELYFKLTDAGDGTYTWTTTAVTTKADGTELTPNLVYTQTGINVSRMKAFVSVEKSWLEVLEQKLYSVSKTITSAGWATYCSPYALDFSSAIANLDAAYLITSGDGTYVTTEEITGTIPANTGILLKGEGMVTIPVVASSGTNVSSNKLIGVTTATTLDLDDDDDGTADTQIYVLLNETTGENRGIGFYLTETSVTSFSLGANTAYLPSNFAGGSARSFFSLWNDETTSISENIRVNSDKFATSPVFNLNGQRIEKPAKGLYIQNGKKIIVK